MAVTTKNLWLIKLALNIAGGGMLRALNKGSKNCAKSQYKALMNVVNYAKNTEFGKEHGFSEITSIEEFQKRVPIRNYEELRPYITRHTKGEENVLFPGKPMIYATTSGTTKEPKWIPITEKYYKECYNGLSKLWFYSLLKENPHVFDGPSVSIVGKKVEGYADDGTSFGSFSGHVHANIPKVMLGLHSVLPVVHDIPDYNARYYCIMRLSIEQDIHLIITGNPSTLLELNNVTQNHYNEFIEDIRNGTLNKHIDVPKEIRDEIEAALTPNPERAKELAQLKDTHDTVLPKHYWPNLQTINTWMCGNSGLYLQHTKGFYPDDIRIREFGYIATEARASIALVSDTYPSILVGHLLFFEFIKKSDIGETDPKIYLAHELEKGEEYYVIVTTSSGLYRYDMNDIIRVEDFYNEFPMIRFIQKGAGITSLTGEKLHETQFLAAVKATEEETGLQTKFHICFADFATSSYHLFAEFADKADKKALDAFGKTLDKKMQAMNEEYESKRKSNRLKPLVPHALKQNAFNAFKTACMAKGYRDGQFKLTHLMHDKERMAIFKELVTK